MTTDWCPELIKSYQELERAQGAAKGQARPEGGQLRSLAHPGWPYSGTGHAWRGFAENRYQRLRFGPDLD
jgi:hypothetical protein